ncbi:MAG: hypothetical protein J6J70_04085, partial [Methanocorpusculaceae archaeon]|nr:hypothetical protein [Methanocorpusculaceae archaeon]
PVIKYQKYVRSWEKRDHKAAARSSSRVERVGATGRGSRRLRLCGLRFFSALEAVSKPNKTPNSSTLYQQFIANELHKFYSHRIHPSRFVAYLTLTLLRIGL